ncbi:MAG: SRPBCC domain-containing protein [Planctomycetes bacterium]|nr:SRPBCC domain-containing protein [Planctomycetota bacterium]
MDDSVADLIFIDAEPERVFEALVEPEEILCWLELEAAIVDMFQGGSYSLRRADGSRASGTITAFEPPELLEVSDWFEESAEGRRGPMTVRFELRPEGDGVWVTVRQEGLATGPGWKAFAERTREAWVRATVALKRHVEQI